MPSVARERELTDCLRNPVGPLLPAYTPSQRGGRGCFEAAVFVLRDGLPRRDLPDRLPPPVTCRRRHRDWTEAGV